MTEYYTDEKNVQIVLALLKVHGIRKVVASPGATNVTLIRSMQNDAYFEMYSSVDERSAAYMACGLAAESDEPVVISCTGATASRNYMPGLTEAFYRKLPILVITATQVVSRVGHHIAQVIDRSKIPNDVAKFSVELPVVKDDEDFWNCEIKVNKAILELKRHGGGPVHINLPTTYCRSYNTKSLPPVKVIDRIYINSVFPELPLGKVAIFVGTHRNWTKDQIESLDRFCTANNAVVFCDHTSNYKGKYRVLYSLIASQEQYDLTESKADILIHIGEITGDYYSLNLAGKQVWRVNEDGEIRDTFGKLRYVFEMSEQMFFEHYSQKEKDKSDKYLQFCKNNLERFYNKLPELPFSNVWLASKIAHRIPEGATIHFGILNSLRTWNFFEIPNSVFSASNVGGFGIDGGVSSIIGASLANKSKLYFEVIGDLAFFYDMNALGNRHLGKNLRILLVNNGKGTEFRQYSHHAADFGDETDEFIAAAGHFGNKSQILVKHYAQDLGFEYLCASDKEQFEDVCERFLTSEITEKPILLEVFTNSNDESDALELMRNIEINAIGKVKQLARKFLSDKSRIALKKAIEK